MRYPNSEMISTYDGYTEGTRHTCEVLLREDAIVVEYLDGNARITYPSKVTDDGGYALELVTPDYAYSATLALTDEDILEGRWQETSGDGTRSAGTWCIELGK